MKWSPLTFSAIAIQTSARYVQKQNKRNSMGNRAISSLCYSEDHRKAVNETTIQALWAKRELSTDDEESSTDRILRKRGRLEPVNSSSACLRTMSSETAGREARETRGERHSKPGMREEIQADIIVSRSV